jgi:hypothetical protein
VTVLFFPSFPGTHGGEQNETIIRCRRINVPDHSSAHQGYLSEYFA